MKLTKRQKKFIKKNLKFKSLTKIAADLGIKEEEVRKYLKKIYSPKKFNKFITQKSKNNNQNQENLIKQFNLKKWLEVNQVKLVILCFVGVGVYLNSLGNKFVSDDIYTFLEDKDFGNLPAAFKSFPIILRPFIFFLIKNIFGLRPFWYRLVNLFFHLGSVWATYLLASLIIGAQVGFLAALILASHPLQIEAVSWISGGPYVQYSFFVLLGLIFYLLKEKNKQNYYFSLLSFGLALLSSEKATSFPFLLLVLTLALGKTKKEWRWLILPFFIGAAWILFYYLRIPVRIVSLETGSAQRIEKPNPFFQIPIAITSYLGLIFWPDKLTLYHSEMQFSQGQYWLAILVFLTVISLIFYWFYSKRPFFLWPSFFIIALLPTLTPFGISWIVAERYVYLGAIGIYILVALAIEKLAKIEKLKIPVYLLFGLIIISLSVRTIRRNVDWKNQDNLWLAVAKTSPSSPQNHNNLGDLYSRRGEVQKAIEHFQKAIELLPGYADAYHNLGNVYAQIGELDLAIASYQQATKYNFSLWQSHQSLASCYLRQGKLKEAKVELETVLQLRPDDEQVKQLLQKLTTQ